MDPECSFFFFYVIKIPRKKNFTIMYIFSFYTLTSNSLFSILSYSDLIKNKVKWSK